MTRDTITGLFQNNKFATSILKAVTPVMLMALAGWVWNTNADLAVLESKMRQDRAQWEAIKAVTDDTIELRVRVSVLERLRGMQVPELEEGGDSPRPHATLDIKKIFDDIKQKRYEPPQQQKHEVNRFIQMKTKKK